MIAADRFAHLPALLPAETDLIRRGRWLDTACRVDVGPEAFHLGLREGRIDTFERGPRLLRSVDFTFRATEEAWTQYWQPVPPPGWHDLLALTKRGAASVEGDLRPFLQNLQYFKDLLALPRQLVETG
jgi:hypothetical protein